MSLLQNSINRRIFTAAAVVGSASAAVKLVTLIKEIYIAKQFGTGDAFDAFLIAFLIPSFVINVVAGSFNAALIPVYVQVQETDGRDAAQKLFSNIMLWSIVLLGVICIIFALAGTYLIPLLGSGFNLEKLALTRSLYVILLPIIVINGLTTIWGSVLNSDKQFSLAAISPIATQAAILLSLLLFSNLIGIYSIVFGTIGGLLLEVGILAWGLKRNGLSLLPRWNGMDQSTKLVVKQYIPMVAGAFLMCGTLLVDQSMAAMLGPGSVSALSYGSKMVSLINGLGAMALGTAALPYFSSMVASGDWGGLKHTIKTYFRLLTIISVPLVLILIYLSDPIIRVVFERGAFTATDTFLVNKIQILYLLQIPFYMLGIFGVRLLSSLCLNKVIMLISLVNLIVNVFGNYILMNIYGVAGIALSTSIVYLFSCALIFVFISKNLRGKQL